MATCGNWESITNQWQVITNNWEGIGSCSAPPTEYPSSMSLIAPLGAGKGISQKLYDYEKEVREQINSVIILFMS